MRARPIQFFILLAAVAVVAACGSSQSSSSSSSSRTTRVGTAATRTPGAKQTLPPAIGALPAAQLSAADVKATLDAHNAWRAKYNETPLTWDDSLASLAQDWSNQMAQSGNFDHRPDNPKGENIFSGTGTYAPKDVVDAWGNEVSDYHQDTNTCNDGAQCGHFTQIVWASTTKVGCASATAADGTIYWTCNYDPAGNITGVSPFDAAAQQ